VATAGLTFIASAVVKERSPALRTYLSVDGGMSDNPRRSPINRSKPLFWPTSPPPLPAKTVTLVGKALRNPVMWLSTTSALPTRPPG